MRESHRGCGHVNAVPFKRAGYMRADHFPSPRRACKGRRVHTCTKSTTTPGQEPHSCDRNLARSNGSAAALSCPCSILFRSAQDDRHGDRSSRCRRRAFRPWRRRADHQPTQQRTNAQGFVRDAIATMASFVGTTFMTIATSPTTCLGTANFTDALWSLSV